MYIYIHVRYPHQRNLLIRAGNLLLSGMFLTLDSRRLGFGKDLLILDILVSHGGGVALFGGEDLSSGSGEKFETQWTRFF